MNLHSYHFLKIFEGKGVGSINVPLSIGQNVPIFVQKKCDWCDFSFFCTNNFLSSAKIPGEITQLNLILDSYKRFEYCTKKINPNIFRANNENN